MGVEIGHMRQIRPFPPTRRSRAAHCRHARRGMDGRRWDEVVSPGMDPSSTRLSLPRNTSTPAGVEALPRSVRRFSPPRAAPAAEPLCVCFEPCAAAVRGQGARGYHGAAADLRSAGEMRPWTVGLRLCRLSEKELGEGLVREGVSVPWWHRGGKCLAWLQYRQGDA